MNNITFFFLLLISLSINVSADEKPVPAKDAKKQASTESTSNKVDRELAEKKQPTGRELIQQSLEMARLAAEIDRKRELYAKGPKRKFISAATQDPIYHAYMKVMVKKLEDVGNANYPKTLKYKNLSGQLTVTIAIGRDGSVVDISINKSSGNKLIDDAVFQIVESSAPFAPLPETKDNPDFLHITRTWDFGNNNRKSF